METICMSTPQSRCSAVHRSAKKRFAPCRKRKNMTVGLPSGLKVSKAECPGTVSSNIQKGTRKHLCEPECGVSPLSSPLSSKRARTVISPPEVCSSDCKFGSHAPDVVVTRDYKEFFESGDHPENYPFLSGEETPRSNSGSRTPAPVGGHGVAPDYKEECDDLNTSHDCLFPLSQNEFNTTMTEECPCEEQSHGITPRRATTPKPQSPARYNTTYDKCNEDSRGHARLLCFPPFAGDSSVCMSMSSSRRLYGPVDSVPLLQLPTAPTPVSTPLAFSNNRMVLSASQTDVSDDQYNVELPKLDCDVERTPMCSTPSPLSVMGPNRRLQLNLSNSLLQRQKSLIFNELDIMDDSNGSLRTPDAPHRDGLLLTRRFLQGILNGDHCQVENAVRDHHQDVNCPLSVPNHLLCNGQSSLMLPIFIAALYSTPFVLQILIDSGAPVQSVDSDGQTPLHAICRKAANLVNVEKHDFGTKLLSPIEDRECHHPNPLFSSLMSYLDDISESGDASDEYDSQSEETASPPSGLDGFVMPCFVKPVAIGNTLSLNALIQNAKVLISEGIDVEREDVFGNDARFYAEGTALFDELLSSSVSRSVESLPFCLKNIVDSVVDSGEDENDSKTSFIYSEETVGGASWGYGAGEPVSYAASKHAAFACRKHKIIKKRKGAAKRLSSRRLARSIKQRRFD